MQSASYALIKILQAAANEDVTKDLNKINVPTKIFRRSRPTNSLQSAELTQQRIKNSQLHALTNSGHGSPIDQADELNKELIKFYMHNNCNTRLKVNIIDFSQNIKFTHFSQIYK